jgi:hypothetical protein
LVGLLAIFMANFVNWTKNEKWTGNLLAQTNVLRIGKIRERKLAITELKNRLS